MNLDPFRPHPLLRGGHLQTLAATLIKPPRSNLTPLPHRIDLNDGDHIVLHDDQPASWTYGQPSLLMIHGLGGCHSAAYMIRMAQRFHAQGTRVFRIDMRGCGDSLHLAAKLNHAGRSLDILAALNTVHELTKSGPIGVVGVSLGGNQLLKLLGEIGTNLVATNAAIDRLSAAVAVAPPIDLVRCSDNMQRWHMRPYNQYFISRLLRNIPLAVQQSPEFKTIDLRQRPATLYELDDRITAPLSGFQGATDYYQSSSSIHRLTEIQIPTLVITAKDDPIVPVNCFHTASWSEQTQLEITNSGGHVGFVSTRSQTNWLDRHIEKWFAIHHR